MTIIKKRFYFYLIATLLFLNYGNRLEATIYEPGAAGPKSAGMMGAVAATADEPLTPCFLTPPP